MKILGKLLKWIDFMINIIQRKIYLLFLHRSKSLGLIDEFHFVIKSEWVKRGKLIEGIDLFLSNTSVITDSRCSTYNKSL